MDHWADCNPIRFATKAGRVEIMGLDVKAKREQEKKILEVVFYFFTCRGL